MVTVATQEYVDNINSRLRSAERALEHIGRDICSIPNSVTAWSGINSAIEGIAEAIRSTHLMLDGGAR